MNEVVLLEPGEEGTIARIAGDLDEVKELLHGGMNLAEIVMPKTRPAFAQQLLLLRR